MLGKATQLEPNITGISRDFKRARYQKLAFVEIWVLASTRALLTKKLASPTTCMQKCRRPYIHRYRGDILVSHFLATIFKIELWLTPGFIDMVLVHRTNMFKISENHVITTYDVINEFRFIFVIR